MESNLVSSVAIEFCQVCCHQADIRTHAGSSYIYTRDGRFDPFDLNDLFPLVEAWNIQNICHISMNHMTTPKPFWRVVIAIGKRPFNVTYQSPDLPEALMSACIEAQKAMEAA